MGNIDGYFDCEIEEEIAVLNTHGKYTLELNRVSFNGYPANYDIRRWGVNAAGAKYPSRGVSLNRAELVALKKQLNDMEI